MVENWEKGEKFLECKDDRKFKIVVGIPSQCIYRMIQGFLTHGNDPWYCIVHGICPWFLTHSHFRVFFVLFGNSGVMLK